MSNLRFVDTKIADIHERKKQLRAYMKSRRADNQNRDTKHTLLAQNCIALFKELFDSKLQAGKKLRCFCYLSYSQEAETDMLVETLQGLGVEVLAPRVEGDKMVAVPLCEDLALSKWGIREPVGEAYAGEVDCIILPLLAVDEQGNRLGYGRGYYDKFLSVQKTAVTIAYCYDFQVLLNVPTETTDEPVQYIVTDKRVEKIKKDER